MVRKSAIVSTQKRRRRNTIIWVAAAVAAIITLMWLEQIALLYVAATLGLVLMLVVVAMNDLGEAQVVGGGASGAPLDDSPALAERLPAGASTFGSKETRRL